MRRSGTAAFCWALVVLPASPVGALELGAMGQDSVVLDVTQASSLYYNTQNRDERSGQVVSHANDDWGALYQRTNLLVSSGRLRLSLRVDDAWFYASPSPAEVGERTLSDSPSDPVSQDPLYPRKVTEAGIELSNRYINWVYPAKVLIAYGTPDLELAIGDSYAQLGRGLVLSLRKVDELSSDTTVRGARISAREKLGDVEIRGVALGGSLNPLRIDEASGRYLGSHPDVTPGFVRLTEAGMPRAIETDFVDRTDLCQSSGTCSYAPDRLVAGQVEVRAPGLSLGTQASLLARQVALSQDVTRTADRILTASQSLELIRLGEGATVYLEGAIQKLSHRDAGEPDLSLGHAVYLAGTFIDPRYSLIVEAKHYRRFFPLSANVSVARAREFAQVQYSAPPTTEEIWNDTQTENFNVCVTGGRLRGEVHADRSHSVYAWLGHYRSYAESVTNESCEIAAENENRVWDAAVGSDLRSASRGARADLSVGTRFDQAGRELGTATGSTPVFYRELYTRYSLAEPLAGTWTLELRGVERWRRQTLGGPEEPWVEGEHSIGVDVGEALSVAWGIEHDGRPDAPDTYLNGQLSYRPSELLVLGLFAGQRRGALRCVGGVCRFYPPFEGARLDATLRF